MANHKSIKILLSALLLLCICLTAFSCGEAEQPPTPTTHTDYASELRLDMASDTLKTEATVHLFVDGDTTHFNVPSSVSENGILKARYLAVNTPESTGKVEAYGKTAAAYTREKLESATSILLESDDNRWNIDSTGGRYLVWVWYKTAENAEYRNLNLELLQNGLAIAMSSANNRYGETCVAAIAKAKAEKMNVHSGAPDPNFYYGDAVELTLSELRLNIKEYEGIKVAFEGVITKNSGNSIYLEDFDPESGLYYGISVYYGYGLTGDGLDILSVGNRSRIVGTVQYYEAGGTYQVSGLTYRQLKPKDPSNIQKISDGHSPAFVPTSAETFTKGKVTLTVEDEEKVFDYAALTMNTSLSMEKLVVKSIYTTDKEDSSSNGSMTLTCECDGIKIVVRTVPLTENGVRVTADAFEGKVISVKGIVDIFEGTYQIKVFSKNDITICNE